MTTNPWFAIASFIIAVSSVLLAIALFIKGRRVKLPRYAIRSSNIFKDLVSKVGILDVRYGDEQIENLTVSKVAFWNAGRETIHWQDVADADLLRLQATGGYKILSATILHQKNPANKFRIKKKDSDGSIVWLIFDYIDKGEGVVLQLFHTGASSEDIRFYGTIKGFGKPVEKPITVFSPPKYTFGIRNPRLLVALSELYVPVAVTAFFAIMIYFMPDDPEGSKVQVAVILSFFIAIMWASGLVKLRRRIPSGFEAFEEEL